MFEHGSFLNIGLWGSVLPLNDTVIVYRISYQGWTHLIVILGKPLDLLIHFNSHIWWFRMDVNINEVLINLIAVYFNSKYS